MKTLSILLFATCVALSAAYCERDKFDFCVSRSPPTWIHGLVSDMKCDRDMSSIKECFRDKGILACPDLHFLYDIYFQMVAVCAGCNPVNMRQVKKLLNGDCKAYRNRIAKSAFECDSDVQNLVDCVGADREVDDCRPIPDIDMYLNYVALCETRKASFAEAEGGANLPKPIFLLYVIVVCAAIKTCLN